jgi:hypothetical protein
MTVVLELKPEIEARVIALAARQGVSVEKYIQNFLESLASLDEEPSHHPLTPEQWVSEFEEWLDSHDYITAPPLTDDAINRESIYREREDSQIRAIW